VDRDSRNLREYRRKTNRGDWNPAINLIHQLEINWVLGTFKPFKSVGKEEIAPALSQQAMEHLIPYLCNILTECLAYGYISVEWRQFRRTIVPKSGKSDYTEAKAYRPNSLSSFLLKRIGNRYCHVYGGYYHRSFPTHLLNIGSARMVISLLHTDLLGWYVGPETSWIGLHETQARVAISN
jgi:hypothetical protein